MPAVVTMTPVRAATNTLSRSDAGIGTLEFSDGYPTTETAEKARDHLECLHGVETFMNSSQEVSTSAIRQGFPEAGINDGDVLTFSELMDSRSLLLTVNADTGLTADLRAVSPSCASTAPSSRSSTSPDRQVRSKGCRRPPAGYSRSGEGTRHG